MTSSTPVGVGLAVVAGFMSGNCMLPLKYLRSWQWENMWAAFSLISLVVLPWALALLLVSHLFAVYSSLPASVFLAPVGFGIAWGIAQILFGISVVRLGLSLAYAIIVGMGAALGTLIPMFAADGSALRRSALLLVLAGIVLMAAGIVFTAWSGRLREKSAEGAASSRGRSGYRAAIALAVLCGFLAPMLNYSFAFGQEIAQRGIAFGNSPLLASYAVWPIGLAGGFLPNAGYSAYLLARNRSWPSFKRPSPDLLLSTLMAMLWMGAFSVYGMAAAWLGDLGTSIGWGLFQIFMIIAASLSGLLTGEWKRTPVRCRLFLMAGMFFLLAATLLLSAANRH